jgi:hypothetical protein
MEGRRERKRFVVATMPKLVRQIIENAEEAVGHEIKVVCSRTPGVCLEKNPEERTIMESQYRSIKSVVPCDETLCGGSNPVRELRNTFSNPERGALEAIREVRGYLIDNEDDIKLTYRKPRELRIVTSMATMLQRRPSCQVHCITWRDVIANWLCKTQNVSLSLRKRVPSVGYGFARVLFQRMLLKEIAYCVDPAINLEDNTGGNLLVKNHKLEREQKHINTRYHFL